MNHEYINSHQAIKSAQKNEKDFELNVMLSSISPVVAEYGKRRMDVCYNAIESVKQMSDCYDCVNNIFDFATYFIYQGLRNVTHVYFNNTGLVRISSGQGLFGKCCIFITGVGLFCKHF